jgi:hypothetical protein
METTWTEQWSRSYQQYYWYNAHTQERSWENPATLFPTPTASNPSGRTTAIAVTSSAVTTIPENATSTSGVICSDHMKCILEPEFSSFLLFEPPGRICDPVDPMGGVDKSAELMRAMQRLTQPYGFDVSSFF